MSALRTLDVADVRRLAISRQHLSAAPVPGMLDVVRDLGCLQLDPISAVQRNHLLVLWSRLGNYDPAQVDRLIYEDRALFEYWAHVASIVATDDYPIFHHWMQDYPYNVPWGQAIQQWLEDASSEALTLRQLVLDRMRAEGALAMRSFEGKDDERFLSSGWTSPNTIGRMFDYLWHAGAIMVSHRKGMHRFWDLTERCLPEWVSREPLTRAEVVSRAAQKAIRCLGVATPKQINEHFTRNRYPDLPQILDNMVAENIIEPVQIQKNGKNLPGNWYLHREDVPLVERIQAGDWQGKTTLLSPFDNLICDRKRLNLLFDFDFTVEIYVPQVKRKFGYYVLSILHGDRLIGRMDPLMDRKTNQLNIKAVFAEDGAPKDKKTVAAIRTSIDALGTFLGANNINFGTVPEQWAALKQ
jgi:uncharacterized protein YcaQ